jgi:hypothetical protein
MPQQPIISSNGHVTVNHKDGTLTIHRDDMLDFVKDYIRYYASTDGENVTFDKSPEEFFDEIYGG